MSKVIDFALKGNVIRLYCGNDDETEYWGDDWNDRPYEHNAGSVYSEYVSKVVDLFIRYDCDVLEPCSGEYNSPWSKEDMKRRDLPCVIVVPPPEDKYTWNDDRFSKYAGSKRKDLLKIYFEDDVDKIKNPYIVHKEEITDRDVWNR